MTADDDRKPTGSNFGCTLQCEFPPPFLFPIIQRRHRDFRCTPEVVTKLGCLHSASTWPPFHLCARSVALKFAPAPRRTFSQLAWGSCDRALELLVRERGRPQANKCPQPGIEATASQCSSV